MLRLELLLLGLAVTLGFFHVDGVLVFVAILRLIEPNLDGDQIGVHSMDHMLSLAFDHLCLIMLVLNCLQPVKCRIQPRRLAIHTVFNGRLVDFRLLQLPLFLLELALFS